jgi:hypothetical protein
VKLPALCLAASFAGGVALGLSSALVNFIHFRGGKSRGLFSGANTTCCVLDFVAQEPDRLG